MWVLVALGLGTLLTLGASGATANVTRGPVFVRWMLLVFAAFVALATLPMLAGN